MFLWCISSFKHESQETLTQQYKYGNSFCQFCVHSTVSEAHEELPLDSPTSSAVDDSHLTAVTEHSNIPVVAKAVQNDTTEDDPPRLSVSESIAASTGSSKICMTSGTSGTDSVVKSQSAPVGDLLDRCKCSCISFCPRFRLVGSVIDACTLMSKLGFYYYQ